MRNWGRVSAGWVVVRIFSGLWTQVFWSTRIALLSMALPGLLAMSSRSEARELIARPITLPAQDISPLILVVSIKKQKVRIFDANGEVTSSRISSGQPGFDTPTGVFSILEKNEHHESNIYEGAEMPFMQRITWSGIALHAGVVPGYRASHGCIRLPYSFAKSLFGVTHTGNRVIVMGDEARPVTFEHAKLFKPLPLNNASAQGSAGAPGQKVATNDKTMDFTASDRLADLPNFIGVTPALAEAVADLPPASQRRPTSRAEADRMITEKVARLQADLKAAENARNTATERAKSAVKAADPSNGKLEEARRELDPARDAVEIAEKKQQEALRTYESFMRAPSLSAPMGPDPKKTDSKLDDKSGSNKANAAPDDREADLEDAILDATIEADAARADLARGEMRYAEVKAEFAGADTARNAALEAVQQAQADLRSAQAALIDMNKEIVRHSKPVSVFISLKTERIYIRQGTEPLLEAPITITRSPGRIGTHVFTAMRYGAANPNAFEWQLVTAKMPSDSDLDEDTKSKKSKRRDDDIPQTSSSSLRLASTALDAIAIPPDIQATITELARPGASLIVSDRELPLKENGLGTEFVLLTR